MFSHPKVVNFLRRILKILDGITSTQRQVTDKKQQQQQQNVQNFGVN